MHRLTDSELIDELRERFEENKRSLHDLKQLTKKLEEVNKKLQDSEKLKSNFLSNIRNEINNPLSSIMGLAENILTVDNRNVNKVHPLAKLIHSEAFNLDFQLKNIFIAAELEAGEATPFISNVNIFELINRLIDVFKHEMTEKKQKINFINEIGGDEYCFKTDAEKLHLSLSNLLYNALEFSNESDHIEVKVCLKNGCLHISIKDFGIGISQSDQKVIFDRFKQLDVGTTKEHKGHGLGLSVTKAIIELLNGTISVASTVNEGTVFTVTLPEANIDPEMETIAFDGNELLFYGEEIEL